MLKNFFYSLYINNLVFYCLTIVVSFYILANFFNSFEPVAFYSLVVLITISFIDFCLLFVKYKGINATRTTPEKFSNGDDNIIVLNVINRYPYKIYTDIIDEIPFQFQNRNFKISKIINPKSEINHSYKLKPNERGEYHFGNINIYTKTRLGLISKRYQIKQECTVKTYPSFIQLKKFDLLAFSNNLSEHGLKKIRRIGHTLEFEQIKEYTQGDDLRTVNWKATAKRNSLMVNQYQDEKSQPIYSVIDKGRTMKMPFNNLSLLDYAINATLVLSNVALKKQDKAGLLSFSKQVENVVVAERRSSQMRLILESLYNIKTNYIESNYSRLYADLKRTIKQRSLIMLYTNFETLDGLKRQLPYLRAISKNHVLVVVFFKNTELNRLTQKKATTIQDVYDKVIAEKFIFEKKQIVTELKKYGIHSILTEPENLSLDTINKYLELKSRGLH